MRAKKQNKTRKTKAILQQSEQAKTRDNVDGACSGHKIVGRRCQKGIVQHIIRKLLDI